MTIYNDPTGTGEGTLSERAAGFGFSTSTGDVRAAEDEALKAFGALGDAKVAEEFPPWSPNPKPWGCV